LIRKLLKEESGYSLVEVLVSIVILSIAIIPMVGMLDMGLQMATRSGNYDTARAFANTKLEQAKSLSYTQVKDNFPSTGNTTPSSDTPAPIVASTEEPGVPADFKYSVRKRYLGPPPPGFTGTTATLTPGGTTDTGLIELKVTVSWGNSSYSTTGVVARGTL
jgi:prepilin-type N-terminal cleavage/methylation domain-containing protein